MTAAKLIELAASKGYRIGPTMDAVENPRPKTHLATNLWRVGPYSFLEAMPKVGTDDDRPIYFAYGHGNLLRRESFDTLEDAMRYAARPSSDRTQ